MAVPVACSKIALSCEKLLLLALGITQLIRGPSSRAVAAGLFSQAITLAALFPGPKCYSFRLGERREYLLSRRSAGQIRGLIWITKVSWRRAIWDKTVRSPARSEW